MDRCGNSVALQVMIDDDTISQLDSNIKVELEFFQKETRQYLITYKRYRTFLGAMKLIIDACQIAVMIGSSAVAIWAKDYSDVIIPTLGIIGTLLFMFEGMMKKAGLLKMIEKYGKLALKAMKCEIQILAFQDLYLKDNEVTPEELRNFKRKSLALRLALHRYSFQIDTNLDEIYANEQSVTKQATAAGARQESKQKETAF